MSLPSIEFSKKYGKRTNKMKQFVFKTLKFVNFTTFVKGEGESVP